MLVVIEHEPTILSKAARIVTRHLHALGAGIRHRRRAPTRDVAVLTTIAKGRHLNGACLFGKSSEDHVVRTSTGALDAVCAAFGIPGDRTRAVLEGRRRVVGEDIRAP